MVPCYDMYLLLVFSSRGIASNPFTCNCVIYHIIQQNDNYTSLKGFFGRHTVLILIAYPKYGTFVTYFYIDVKLGESSSCTC